MQDTSQDREPFGPCHDCGERRLLFHAADTRVCLDCRDGRLRSATRRVAMSWLEGGAARLAGDDGA